MFLVFSFLWNIFPKYQFVYLSLHKLDHFVFLFFCSLPVLNLRINLKCKCVICGVIVIAVGNGHGDTSSNPGRDWLHFTLL